MLFILVMQSWIFSIIAPVFSVTWSSEIILESDLLLKKHLLSIFQTLFDKQNIQKNSTYFNKNVINSIKNIHSFKWFQNLNASVHVQIYL